MHANLISESFRDISVQAFSHPLVAPFPNGFKGGPVLDRGGELDRLRHTRYWKPVDSFSAETASEVRIGGEWTYAGPIYPHFGHYMSEMVHRFLPSVMQYECDRMLFVGIRGEGLGNDLIHWPRMVREVVEFFQVGSERVEFVSEHSRVEKLNVVEAGSDFGGGPKPGYLLDLREFSSRRLRMLAPEQLRDKKVYVSRGLLPMGRSFLGEAYIESILADDGFEMFYPERHSLAEQMSVYASADIVVFPEGSACHGTELLGEAMMRRCVLLARRSDHVEIFARVLKPRSTHFAVLTSPFELGSVVGDRGTVALAHAGVSMIDIINFRRFFREQELSGLRGFCLESYLSAARNDLAGYIAFNIARDRVTSLEDLVALSQRFDAVEKRVRAAIFD